MKIPPHTKALTFDVGGTLIEPFPSVGHIYANVAARHGHPNVPGELLTRRFIAAWRELKNFNYTREEWARLVDATFDGLIESPPSKTFFPELYRDFALPDAWRVFPDVRAALETLASRGLKLGIISNWDERLRPLLRELDLERYFDPMIISCEDGHCKPEQAIFEAASKKLGLPGLEILHVGDSFAHDVQGARDAGFQACLLSRNSKTREKDQILSLGELCSGNNSSNSSHDNCLSNE